MHALIEFPKISFIALFCESYYLRIKNLSGISFKSEGSYQWRFTVLLINSNMAWYVLLEVVISSTSFSTWTAWTQRCLVLNSLSVDAVYPFLLLYPPETPVPSLSFHNLLLGSLLCPLAFWFLLDSICKGLCSVKFDVIVAGHKWRQI